MLDILIVILKYISGILIVIAPAIKLYLGKNRDHHRQLEDRYRRIKLFLEEGGTDQHPLLVESAFGSAMGHTKFDASEISLILRQKEPTSFMSTYLRVREYISPNQERSRFELRTLAAKALLRNILIWIGIILYASFCGSSLWLLFFLSPKLALAQSWSNFIGTVSLAIFFGAAAAYCLYEASRLHWAFKLFDTQK